MTSYRGTVSHQRAASPLAENMPPPFVLRTGTHNLLQAAALDSTKAFDQYNQLYRLRGGHWDVGDS